jgi:hypothetical protein
VGAENGSGGVRFRREAVPVEQMVHTRRARQTPAAEAVSTLSLSGSCPRPPGSNVDLGGSAASVVSDEVHAARSLGPGDDASNVLIVTSISSCIMRSRLPNSLSRIEPSAR